MEEGRLTVPYVKSAENLADLFTKALPPAQFFVLRDRVMNVPLDRRQSMGGCGIEPRSGSADYRIK